MNRIDEILEAKSRVLVEKQNGRMQERHRQSDVARPVVQTKIVEPAMRPGTMWAVPKRHERPKQQVQRDYAHGYESDVCGKVEYL